MADGKTIATVKTTAVITAAVVVLALQVLFLRVIGDVISSVAIFALGYTACLMRSKQ